MLAEGGLVDVAWTGCGGDEETDEAGSSSGAGGSTGSGGDVRQDCEGDLCVDIFRAFHSTEPCDGAPEETCNDANVYSLLDQGTTHVTDLAEGDVQMTTGDRDGGGARAPPI